jgi:hypothetical protein
MRNVRRLEPIRGEGGYHIMIGFPVRRNMLPKADRRTWLENVRHGVRPWIITRSRDGCMDYIDPRYPLFDLEIKRLRGLPAEILAERIDALSAEIKFADSVISDAALFGSFVSSSRHTEGYDTGLLQRIQAAADRDAKLHTKARDTKRERLARLTSLDTTDPAELLRALDAPSWTI